MEKVKIRLVCLATLLLMAGVAQAKEWRGITPLHSTQQDVERILGKPVRLVERGAIYEVSRESALIIYSVGDCQKWAYDWQVAGGTVVAIYVYPEKGLKFKDLKLEGKKFRESVDVHYGIHHYIDDTEGFSVRISEQDQAVQLFNYYPTAKEQHLRCPKTSKIRHRPRLTSIAPKRAQLVASVATNVTARVR